MGMCFASDCNHTYKSGCKMYRFPSDASVKAKWEKMIRRADAKPTPFSVVCSCHFVDGIKDNLPTIYERNKHNIFLHSPPEIKQRKKVLRVAPSTASVASTSNIEVASKIRADAKPTPFSVVCSCHFVDGIKDNLPTIYERNKHNIFLHSPPEIKQRKKVLRVAPSTASVASTSNIEVASKMILYFNMPSYFKYKCRLSFCKNKYFAPPATNIKKFFAFPKNEERRKLWFDAVNKCLTDQLNYTSTKIYVCEDHFDSNCFTDTFKKRLNKFAIPNRFENVDSNEGFIQHIPSCLDTNIGDLSTSCKQSTCDVFDVKCNPHIKEIEGSSSSLNLSKDPSTRYDSFCSRTPSVKRILSFTENSISTSKNKRRRLLSLVHTKRVSDLSPRKKVLYLYNRNQSSQICKLKNVIQKSRNQIKSLYNISTSDLFKNIELNLDSSGAAFLKSQFMNCNRKKPFWTNCNKAFALALYKRGPKCYRFLEKLLNRSKKVG
ncbi:hypothetical protein FQR65_LT18505 [Abscondita terminalis]|nr:hypothetical protein FQR65_LT18505 [Abscondita terminalis]